MNLLLKILPIGHFPKFYPTENYLEIILVTIFSPFFLSFWSFIILAVNHDYRDEQVN